MDSEKDLIRPREIAAVFLLFLAVGFAIHQPGFHSPMIYDSAGWIHGKAHLFEKRSLVEVLRIVPARPLFMMSLYANYILGGMDPYFFRLFNAVILAAAGAALVALSLLLFSIAGRAYPQARFHRLAVGGFLGLLFTVHPLQNFVVLYVWQREAILACLFYFSALAAYLAVRSGRLLPTKSAFALIGVLFFAGLLSKENAITLPLVLILAELMFFKQNRSELIRRCLSIGAITVPPLLIYLLLTGSLHGPESQHPQGTVNRLLTYYGDSGLTLLQVVLTETRVFFSYLLTILVPFWANPQLIKAEIVSMSLWNPPTTMTACLGVIILIGLAINYRKRRPVEAFGIIFYFVALIPESLFIPQFLFFGYRPILSMAGVLLILGQVIVSVLERVETKPYRKVYGSYIAAVCLLMVFFFSFQTFRQATAWNPLCFWSDSYLRLPAMSEQVEKKPYWDVVANFSSELISSGSYTEAVEVLKKAASLSSEAEEVAAMLREGEDGATRTTESTFAVTEPAKNVKLPATLLVNLGLALKRSGKIQDAIKVYDRALEIDPASAIAHNNLGMAFQEAGDTARAMEQYRAALALKPDFPEAHYNLGNSLRDIGDLAQSAASLRQATDLRPNYSEAHESLGYTLLMSGKFADGIVVLRRTLALNWRNANVHNALGVALAEQGQAERAGVHFKAALDIDPGHAEAHRNLDMLLRDHGPSK